LLDSLLQENYGVGDLAKLLVSNQNHVFLKHTKFLVNQIHVTEG